MDLKPTHPSHHIDAMANRCLFCDCRPYGRWGHLPCGATEPDETATSFPELFMAGVVRG